MRLIRTAPLLSVVKSTGLNPGRKNSTSTFAPAEQSSCTPIKVEGDVDYLVNRNPHGWVVTLFNDNGIFKPQQGLAQVDRSASVNVSVALKNAKIIEANEWTSDSKLNIQDSSKVELTIPA